MKHKATRQMLLVLGLLIGGVMPLAAVQAADPSSGTVSPGNPAEWDGASGKPPTASATCNGANNPACDNFALTIEPPTSGSYLVTVALQPLGADDWDLEVYAPNGTTILGSSGNSPGALEVVTLSNPAAATYTVAASPFAAPVGYTATATIQMVEDPGMGGGGEQVEFYVYPDPNQHEGGEPSGGINWLSEPASGVGSDNGGSIMFVSSLTTLRVRPNDCTAPATYLAGGAWADISVPTHVVSLDPIGFVDPVTGRMFSDQLAVKSSLLGLSDNDGDSWMQSQGSPFNPGVDHQTLGGGRLAEPLFSQLDGNNPLYNDFAHGVYYASQDVALAQAGLSLDGGQTFGAAVPMYTLADCSGLHGHVKVSPVDGAAYVPNKSCSGEQGLAVSEDNGVTWDIRRIPNSGSGEWDPSVGIATDGTLYFGMDRGGAPLASVSDDEGATWTEPFDVSGGTIKSTAFPQMIAGDPDRAAFAFLGSDTAGALGTDPTFPAVWYPYISMTFDHGATWTTVNISPNDPVQRGTVCDQGTTCGASRNLLDFNDIQVDKRGRPVFYYADGCVGECVTNPNVNTLAAQAVIGRLKSPMGLFAAEDAARLGEPDWPLTTAEISGADVLLSWSEPGDGGNAIDYYEIKRNNVVLVTTPPGQRSYTDGGAAALGATYEVRAHNSEGFSRLKSGCDNSVIPDVVIGPDPFGPCDFEGQQVLSDPAGDILIAGNPASQTPGVAAIDMTRLGISESDRWGDGNVAFVLDVQSTDTLPANTVWPIQFKDPTAGPLPEDFNRFVRMDTQTGVPRFSYGTGTDTSPTTNPGTLADPQSFAEDGKIVVVVPRTAVGATIGQTIDTFLIRVAVDGVVISLTPDNMPNSLAGAGSYTLIGSENCPLDANELPVAVNDEATTEACTPVVINALANDSDGDGDTLVIDGVTAAQNGVAVVINDAGTDKIEYRPNRNFTGMDTFSYTISDGQGGTDTGVITVTVTGGPDFDADGVLDSCDNCIEHANADQCNTNAGGGSEEDLFGNRCDADLDNDGGVTQDDLGLFRSQYGQTGNDLDADLNCDGGVTQPDLGIFRSLFNRPPGPSGLE